MSFPRRILPLSGLMLFVFGASPPGASNAAPSQLEIDPAPNVSGVAPIDRGTLDSGRIGKSPDQGVHPRSPHDLPSVPDQPGVVAERPGPYKDPKAAVPPPRQKLAPFSVQIRSSLRSAKDQIEGARAQLQLADREGGMSPEQLDSLKTQRHEIEEDLRAAHSGLQKLNRSVREYPEIAGSEEYKRLGALASEMGGLASSLRTRSESDAYWRGSAQVRADLNQLESLIDLGINRVGEFASRRLDVRLGS